MVVWLTVAAAADLASFVMPVNAEAPIGPRILGGACAIVSVAALLLMRERTPMGFIYALLATWLGFMVWFTWASPSMTGSITSMLLLLVVAAYAAHNLPSMEAIAYVGVGAACLLAAIVSANHLGELFVPWAFLVAMSFIQVVILGSVVSDLKQQVVIDPLTGLHNRAGLELVVSGPDRARWTDAPTAVLVLDLDEFKAVNDMHGHAEGDRVLRQVGDALLSVCRKDDVAVRCGGDEFVVLLSATDEDGAAAVAARLATEIDAECSFGITRWDPEENLHDAIARADRLMYRAKAQRGHDRRLRAEARTLADREAS